LAVAAPIPEPAPVTMTTFPSNLFIAFTPVSFGEDAPSGRRRSEVSLRHKRQYSLSYLVSMRTTTIRQCLLSYNVESIEFPRRRKIANMVER
jgi:hypothetical protein